MGVAMAKHDHHGHTAQRYQELRDLSDVTVSIPNIVTQFAISAGIDKSLQKDRTENERRVNILMLGGADAGKSTIVKQMRILHMNGFDEHELRSFHTYLRRNVFEIFHEVAVEIQENPVDIAEAEKSLVFRFAENKKWFLVVEEADEVECLLNFHRLKCVQSYLEYYPNYSSLPDNAQFYIPKLGSLLSPNYAPTPEDILHLRVPTIAVHEINFFFDATKIRVVDVGGQRTYRKKWIHCFEGVTAVMFVASMAAYDQALDKVDVPVRPVLHSDVFSSSSDAQSTKFQNRLRDSAQIFGEVLRSKYLLSSAFILFLNKKDLFSKKLSSRPLSKYFNGYSGKNEESAAEFLKEYFLKRKSKRDKDRSIYTHYTCATDTKNVEFVFKAACDIILKKNLASSGIS